MSNLVYKIVHQWLASNNYLAEKDCETGVLWTELSFPIFFVEKCQNVHEGFIVFLSCSRYFFPSEATPTNLK